MGEGREEPLAPGLNSVGPRVESEMRYTTVLHLRNGSPLSVTLQRGGISSHGGAPPHQLLEPGLQLGQVLEPAVVPRLLKEQRYQA